MGHRYVEISHDYIRRSWEGGGGSSIKAQEHDEDAPPCSSEDLNFAKTNQGCRAKSLAVDVVSPVFIETLYLPPASKVSLRPTKFTERSSFKISHSNFQVVAQETFTTKVGLAKKTLAADRCTEKHYTHKNK